jgi:hypothetical protein
VRPAVTQSLTGPGNAPALGLRAGSHAFFIVMQAVHRLEIVIMLFSTLFSNRKWHLGRDRKMLSRRAHLRQSRFVPQLEALEDRTVLSVLTVTSAADDGSAGTLRAVLASAQNGDMIRFARQLNAQTITLTQGELGINHSLGISGPGADKLTISGNGASRIFEVFANTTVIISGLKLTRGLATDGAAILNAGNLTLSGDALTANVAQGVSGGGLFGDGGGRGGSVENQIGATLVVSQCTLTGNQAVGGPEGGNAFGGAIYNEAGIVAISASTFIGNQTLGANGGTGGVLGTMAGGISTNILGVAAGGAMWNDGGIVTVNNSTLSSNLAQGGSSGDGNGTNATFAVVGTATGGAIGSGAFFTTATPALVIAGSILSGNQSLGGKPMGGLLSFGDTGSGFGGAIGASAGDVTVSNGIISGNLTKTIFSFGTSGGGIDDQLDFGRSFLGDAASPALNIVGSTISGNLALADRPSGNASGGGINTNSVNAQVTNTTVSGNQAIAAAGGGFFIFGSFVFFLPGGTARGGGIESVSGSLTINGSAVNNNLAQPGPGGPPGTSGVGGFSSGGGIDSLSQSLVLTNSFLSGNKATGGAGTNGDPSGGGGGGGLAMNSDSASISGTIFVNNLALGAAGSDGGFGGFASGGGAALGETSLQMSNCTFLGNKVIGGDGGSGSDQGPGGPGGDGQGGALANFAVSFGESITVALTNVIFVGNLAEGGAGGDGVTGGNGGSGDGGALFNNPFNFFGGSITVTLNSCKFVGNQARGGAGGAGATGGDAKGGAIWNSLFVDSFAGLITITFSNCTIMANEVLGGSGGSGGNGGNGFGGGLFIDAGTTITVLSSVIAGNEADGGAAGTGASAGQGIGGGVFNLGTFFLDAASIIFGNEASTSDDNVFGPITPI